MQQGTQEEWEVDLENIQTAEGAPECRAGGKLGRGLLELTNHTGCFLVLLRVMNGVKHATCFMSLIPLKKPMLWVLSHPPHPHFIGEQTPSRAVVMALGRGVSLKKWQGSTPTQGFLAPENLLVPAISLRATLLLTH